ncbi:MAG: hypothetical protein ACLFSV_08950 [Alkalispirochaeta sp.]
MKKMLVSVIILAILAEVAFGFGYVPIRIEAGEQVLLFSRTSGWDTAPVISGEFAWRWQLLIPKNVTIYRFPGELRSVTVSSSASLPSADHYRDYLEGDASLDQEIRLRLRYRISPLGIAELAPMGLGADGLEGWYDDFDDQITMVTLETVSQAVSDRLDRADTAVSLFDVVTEEVEKHLTERFPEIEIATVIPEEISIPDPTLYAAAREAYMTVQAQRTETLRTLTDDGTTRQVRQDERLETLARYGEILDRHPVLLEYLEIAAQHGEDPLNIRGLERVLE